MLATLLEAGAPSPGVDLSIRLGPFRAQLALCDHVVSDVVCGPFTGEDALFRLLLLPRRPVAQRARLSRPDGPAIGDIGTLLMRFVVVESELERAARHVGGLDRIWRVRFAALKTILNGLPEDVKRVIRLCDGTRDVRHLCAEGPLAPLVTLRVLDKLLVAGVLVRADVLDDDHHPTSDDGGIMADRRWQSARETSSSTTTPSATSTTGDASTSSLTAPATATATAGTPPLQPEADESSTTKPAPAAAVIDVVAVARQQATPASMISGETALPRPTPRPSEDLQAWLGEQAAFFADTAPHGPKHTPWPLWQLALLLVGGGVLGGLIARACG